MGARRQIDRRNFLSGLTGVAGAFALAPSSLLRGVAPDVPLDAPAALSRPADAPRRSPAALSNMPSHLAWVWQFARDGSKEQIRELLAEHGLGVVLKTNDGVDWMADFDHSPDAVDGPGQVAALAAFFEDGGVPFHAWSVVKGLEPLREARITADVLAAGARSVVLDLEAHSGFWRGDSAAALAFGRELRALQPSAWVSVSIDPRPWEIDRIPLTEFASFASEISPQVYWRSFQTASNVRKFTAAGYTPGEDGVTAGFVLDTALDRLRPFGLPLHPIGDGQSGADEGWGEFIDGAFASDAEAVSVWRVGVTEPSVWRLLADNPARPLSYVIQSGDSLSALAARWNTSVQALAEANGIANPNLIRIGMELRVPRGPSALPPLEYTVQPGDTLGAIAERFDATTATLIEFNQLSDANLLRIGQTLRIPRSGALAPRPLVYSVEWGDSLTAIAQRFDTSIETILALNRISDANLIRIGQELRVR